METTRELTGREREVLAGVARGETNREIAAALGIEERTVKSHLLRIFPKLGVRCRTEALVIGLQRGLVTVERPE